MARLYRAAGHQRALICSTRDFSFPQVTDGDGRPSPIIETSAGAGLPRSTAGPGSVRGEGWAMDQKRSAEERRRLFDLSIDMIGIAGFDGYFKDVGIAWEHTLGLPREELLGKPFIEFVHPDDQERTSAEAASLSAGKNTLFFENRYRCKDGSYRWLEWRCVPYLDEELIYFVARDITERKRLEQERLEADALLRSILETQPGYIVLLDADYRIRLINRLMEGFTREQVIGADFFSFLPPEFHDLVKQTCDEVWRTGKPARYETAGVGAHGKMGWYTAHVGPVLRDGKVVSLTITTEDITERKLAEQGRMTSEARFRAAVEASLDAFIVFRCARDASGDIVDFVIDDLNARAVRSIERSREEAIGKGICELFPRVRTGANFPRYVKVVETGEPMEFDSPVTVLMPGSSARWLHQQVVPLANGIAVYARDITAKKQMEAELRDALERRQLYAEELEQKNQMLATENAERLRTEQIMRKQQEQMRAMSTPIIQAWEGVLVLPVIGALESDRATLIMERLLSEITRTRSSFAVLDLTGVDAVDAATVSHLLSIVRATSLLGSRCLVSGISPSIAQTMVEIGVSGDSFSTFSLLQDALRFALASRGERPATAVRPATGR
jgi:PAS domain S-box-containing protein